VKIVECLSENINRFIEGAIQHEDNMARLAILRQIKEAVDHPSICKLKAAAKLARRLEYHPDLHKSLTRAAHKQTQLF